MFVPKGDLAAVLGPFNPWWRGERVPDLPSWRRSAYREFGAWLHAPPVHRAVLLSGPRQVGKTTLLMQAAEALVASGVPPQNVLYATFDHPLLKLAGVDAVLEAWREREPRQPGPEYLLLDEAQFIRDWGTWVKHQVDFSKQRRIVFTGSAMPLAERGQESGVGRWHTIRLGTLSFAEFLRIKQEPAPRLPEVRALEELTRWSPGDFLRTRELAAPYVGLFHDYLLRGGFPQTAQVGSVTQAQRLLREDIVDKVLKRDMTALFGVRRVLDLEHLFLYLCMHDGGLLDMAALCANLEVKRPTAQSFLELLEATHLVHKLAPHGYGKDVLRARFKVYLADPAIAPAVMLRGKALLDDPAALGVAAETAVFKHLSSRFAPEAVRFSYWRGKRDQEVDLVADAGGALTAYEVKYRATHAKARDLAGLTELCATKRVGAAFVLSKSLDDFGVLAGVGERTPVVRVPAALACYWLSEAGPEA
jgi:predicted AAA+ superfamily ATPase